MLIRRRYLSFLIMAAMATSAQAADAPGVKDFPGSKDHPLVLRFKDSKIIGYMHKSYDETEIPTGKAYEGDGDKLWDSSKTVEGQITRILYVAPKDVGTLEVERNYENALTSDGFTILFKCDKTECGTDGTFSVFTKNYRKSRDFGGDTSLPYALQSTDEQRYFVATKKVDGGVIYVDVFSGLGTSGVLNELQDRTMTEVEVVEPKGMGNSMVKSNSNAIATALETTGKIALEDIYFDTAKATLKPESSDAIAQIAKALVAHPALKIEIDGHTDNTGTAASNLVLSQHRAESVLTELIAEGIDASRLTAKGFGQGKPVAANDSEAGRAKNRRVELVRK